MPSFLPRALVCAVTSFGLVGVVSVLPANAQKLNVKIVERQNSETEYTYVVAGHSVSNSNSNGSANCMAIGNSVDCNGTAQTTTTTSTTPAKQVSYHVRGATFSLQLPDGRVVVVNCDSKFEEHFAGHAGNRRSCRVPLVDELEAEFSGDKAKLKWVVSIDGKKTASETYKILGVLQK
jgi:hypothetical protein